MSSCPYVSPSSLPRRPALRPGIIAETKARGILRPATASETPERDGFLRVAEATGEEDVMTDQPPAGFEPFFRKSPLTDPWEPIYSRRSPEKVVLGLWAR